MLTGLNSCAHGDQPLKAIRMNAGCAIWMAFPLLQLGCTALCLWHLFFWCWRRTNFARTFPSLWEGVALWILRRHTARRLTFRLQKYWSTRSFESPVKKKNLLVAIALLWRDITKLFLVNVYNGTIDAQLSNCRGRQTLRTTHRVLKWGL